MPDETDEIIYELRRNALLSALCSPKHRAPSEDVPRPDDATSGPADPQTGRLSNA